MDYQEFQREHDAVLDACLRAKLDLDGLAGAIDRLSALRDGLQPGAERDQATAQIGELYDMLAEARQMPHTSTPAFAEASLALSRATLDSGSPAERIDRAQAGITEIRGIADRVTDSAERTSVLAMTEPLTVLIQTLEISSPGR